MAAQKSSVSIVQPNRWTTTVCIRTSNADGGEERGVEKKLTNLFFEPKEMILRQVTWSGTGVGALGEVAVINCDIQNNILATFPANDGGSIAPQTTFNLSSKPTAPRFWVTADGTSAFTGFVGTIALTLEFRA